jgi:eukaryotic-like serine/threonine-protein kinase
MIGQIISHYKILEKLGEGGMGIVYKAHDTKLDRTVALKFLPPHLTATDEDKQRFIREAKAAAALNHPNICTVYSVEEHDDQQFISMEYVDGVTLREKLEIGNRKSETRQPGTWNLEPGTAIDYALQIAEALEEAHSKGIIHRDIKPENIMVDLKNRIKVMDFGLAKLRGSMNLTKAGSTLGTVAYMSPEQAMGMELDHRADIWALGVVLYEMLTGRLPFEGEHEAACLYSIVNLDPKPLTDIIPNVSLRFQAIIDKALNKKQESRYRTIAELVEDLICIQKDFTVPDSGIIETRSLLRHIRRPVVAVPVIIVIVVLLLGATSVIHRLTNVRWARNQAIPGIIQLIEEEDYIAAFHLAGKAERYVSGDPSLLNLWPQISREISIHTMPEGADVYCRPYGSIDQEWSHLGKTPIESIRIARGYFRWKIVKDGYEENEMAASSVQRNLSFTLDKTGSIPFGMIRVQGGNTGIGVLPNLSPFTVELDDFLIDKYEVTNRQFQAFVDNGGYQNPEYWTYEFIEDGKPLQWNEALIRFIDATGKPGPANWQLSTFPEGQEDYPVSGVSWYEAAAFAEYSGKSLPTVFHWYKAADCLNSSEILPLSNFEDDGLAPVGKYQGLSRFGTFDMAGNVREWCYNASGEMRYIRGGAWTDPLYMFSQLDAKSPFDRSLSNGFRCVKYLTTDQNLNRAKEPITLLSPRDYSKESPVGDDIFRIYRGLYSYDKIELESEIAFSDDSHKYWTKQKIFFNAGRRGDRMFAYLFIPKDYPPPYQTLIIFPGASALDIRSSGEGETLLSWATVDLIIRSGRAVLYPIFQSTFERGDGYSIYDPMTTNNDHREHSLIWRKEIGRSIDYLETRPDIDSEKLCYYGSSLGSMLGIGFLALEERFRTGILRLGGLSTWELPGDIDPLNFAPRIRVPVLMINGRYDYLYPYETSQLPLLQLLGTPEEDKHLVVFPTDHSLSGYTKETARLVLDWLDRYLGPVHK